MYAIFWFAFFWSARVPRVRMSFVRIVPFLNHTTLHFYCLLLAIQRHPADKKHLLSRDTICPMNIGLYVYCKWHGNLCFGLSPQHRFIHSERNDRERKKISCTLAVDTSKSNIRIAHRSSSNNNINFIHCVTIAVFNIFAMPREIDKNPNVMLCDGKVTNVRAWILPQNSKHMKAKHWWNFHILLYIKMTYTSFRSIHTALVFALRSPKINKYFWFHLLQCKPHFLL